MGTQDLTDEQVELLKEFDTAVITDRRTSPDGSIALKQVLASYGWLKHDLPKFTLRAVIDTDEEDYMQCEWTLTFPLKNGVVLERLIYMSHIAPTAHEWTSLCVAMDLFARGWRAAERYFEEEGR